MMQIPKKIQELCKDPISILRQYHDSETKVIGYTCSNIPEEMIIAANLQPYRVSNHEAKTSPLTPSFLCPFASATLDNILKHKDFFQGFMVAHTCDPMWRIYDILKKKINKPIFLLRIPHNTENELSFDFMKMELARLKTFLEKNFDTKISNGSFSNAIKMCNQTRSLVKDIYMLNRNNEYRVNALDYFQLILASMWMPKSEFNALTEALEFKNKITHGNVRLHLNGTTIYDLNLIKMIEETGGFVASDDLCTGSRYYWNNVEESKNPLAALVLRYLKRTPCPAQNPLEDRLQYISYMIDEFNSQGVITYAKKFCDPILYDVVHIRNKLAAKGIPSLLVDYENPTREIGRIKNRIEAFIETMGG